MVRSLFPSYIVLPEKPDNCSSVYDYLVKRFAYIDSTKWRYRIEQGMVFDTQGNTITMTTRFQQGKKIFYYKHTECEKHIPFYEQILFSDDHVLIAYKPHFLPVIPSGPYVNECLLFRLRMCTNNPHLVPLHRIDKDTAGLVLFSTNGTSRGLYESLFRKAAIRKEYEAIVRCENRDIPNTLCIEKRLEKSPSTFLMTVSSGPSNAKTKIQLIDTYQNYARIQCIPLTGKKHQIRVHCSSSGFPIVNDCLYPHFLPQFNNDYRFALQLLAKRLQFQDPLTNKMRDFSTPQSLSLTAVHNQERTICNG